MDDATPDRAARIAKIAKVIEGWMRSDGFAHRYSREIAEGDDMIPFAAADCAYFVDQMLREDESA